MDMNDCHRPARPGGPKLLAKTLRVLLVRRVIDRGRIERDFVPQQIAIEGAEGIVRRQEVGATCRRLPRWHGEQPLQLRPILGVQRRVRDCGCRWKAQRCHYCHSDQGTENLASHVGFIQV